VLAKARRSLPKIELVREGQKQNTVLLRVKVKVVPVLMKAYGEWMYRSTFS
jgi:hypothetical protein